MESIRLTSLANRGSSSLNTHWNLFEPTASKQILKELRIIKKKNTVKKKIDFINILVFLIYFIYLTDVEKCGGWDFGEWGWDDRVMTWLRRSEESTKRCVWWGGSGVCGVGSRVGSIGGRGRRRAEWSCGEGLRGFANAGRGTLCAAAWGPWGWAEKEERVEKEELRLHEPPFLVVTACAGMCEWDREWGGGFEILWVGFALQILLARMTHPVILFVSVIKRG